MSRVLNHAEAAAQSLLARKVEQGLITPEASQRLFNWGFRIVTQTIANMRRAEQSTDMITAAVQRKKQQAVTDFAQAKDQRARRMSYAELVLGQMFEVVWAGMQEDVAAYQTR